MKDKQVLLFLEEYWVKATEGQWLLFLEDVKIQIEIALSQEHVVLAAG